MFSLLAVCLTQRRISTYHYTLSKPHSLLLSCAGIEYYSEVILKRLSYVALALSFILSLSLAANAFAGPSLEDLSIAEISEMLESSRAKSKSDIKLLMNFGLIIPGGTAKSGLKVVTLHEWDQPNSGYQGFSADSATFVMGNRKWITWWDVKTLGLKRIVLVESKKHFIFGASSDGSRLVIGKAELDGNKTEFDFASFDGTTLKEITELKYNKNSQEDIFGNFAAFGVMDFGMSPAGRWFILSHTKGPLQVWDTSSGSLVYENYNYNNKARGNGFNFSGDDRYVAIVHGGKQVLYSLAPFKKLRDIPYGLITLSSKGNFIAYGGKSLEKMAGGSVCSFDKPVLGSSFTYDDAYWLITYQNAVTFRPTEAKDCPEVETVFIEGKMKGKKYGASVVPAPDGKHYAFVGAFPPHSGNVPVAKVQIFEWAMPEKKTAQVLVKAKRGLKLYQGGLKKQGEAMLRSLVKSDAKILWDADYERKFAKAGVPLDLVGEMILTVANGRVSPYSYMRYSIYACQARQPFLAAKALSEITKGVNDGSIRIGDKDAAKLALINALALKLAGRDDDAYTALIESGLGEKELYLFRVDADAFAPLLKEPDKLALALDIDKSLLPAPGTESVKQDYVDLQGKLVKVLPPATPTMNEPQTTPTAPTVRPAKKKKSSVVLD